MKFIFRWLFRLLILAIVLVVAAVLLKDTVAKAIAEKRIRDQTGMDVTIGRMEIGLLTATFTMEDFKLYNTAEFGGSPFISVPELHLEYDRDALAERRFHLKLVRFNLAEVNVVESKAGKSNITALQDKLNEAKDQEDKKRGGKPKQAGPKFGGIDTLNLSLGKMRQSSLRNPEQKFEIDLGIKNEIVTDIKDQTDLQQKLQPIVLRNGAAALMQLLYLRRGGDTVTPKAPPQMTNTVGK